jgi:hypothetical protein
VIGSYPKSTPIGINLTRRSVGLSPGSTVAVAWPKILRTSAAMRWPILKILNDTQTAMLNEMIDTKLNTLSNSQTERLNELIDIKLNNLSDTQTEKINEQKTIDAILSTINTKIDNIGRRLQSREQRGYVVEQEGECGCQGDLRWSHSYAHDHHC